MPAKRAKQKTFSPEEIRQLVEMARSQGIRRLKMDGFELELVEGWRPPKPGQKVPRGRPTPTAEDFLFWSTGERLSFEPEVIPEAQKMAMEQTLPGKA